MVACGPAQAVDIPTVTKEVYNTKLLFGSNYGFLTRCNPRPLPCCEPRAFLSTKLGAAVWTVDMPGCQDAPTAIRRFARLVLACVGSEGIRAVEYWTNTIHAGSGIPSHIDKDEWLYRQTRTVVSPVTIAVYYADQCRFEGGELEVARVRIAACPNRLIIFAGHLEHQVHNVDAGIRRSLVVNAWRSPPSPPPGSN